MPKRELYDEQYNKRRTKRKLCFKLENAPPINSIKDLIEIGKSSKLYRNINSIMLWKITPYLEELEQMIGMKSLKETLFYQIIYYLQNMHIRNKEGEYLHTILIGSPGTGKTSVAMIIGKIYQEMGILSQKGTFKIAHRDDFVAGYLGQTAIKTQRLLNSCLGGILFIDEVYSLGPGEENKDSFSKEAIDTLTSFLSEHINDFCCIAAGYEKDIKKCFFNVNQGLESRFPWIHKIEDYTSDDLADILLKMIKDINWQISLDKKDLSKLIEDKKHFFKNVGRDIKNFIGKAKMAHSKRVLSLGNEHKFILTKVDFNEAFKMISHNDDKKLKDKTSYDHMYL